MVDTSTNIIFVQIVIMESLFQRTNSTNSPALILQVQRRDPQRVLFEQSATTALPPTQNDGVLFLNTVLAGRQSMLLENKRLRLTPGYFLITTERIKTDKEHFFRNADLITIPIRQNLLIPGKIYPFTDFQANGECCSFSEQLLIHKLFDYDLNLQKLIEQYCCLANSGDEIKRAEVRHRIINWLTAYQKTILLTVLQIPARKFCTQLEVFKKTQAAKNYIIAHFESIQSITEIARASNMSSSLLMRYFRWIFEITPHQYIIKLKVEFAKQLLVTGELPVNEINNIVGFNNVSSFIRLFRTMTGYTPKAYRKKFTRCCGKIL